MEMENENEEVLPSVVQSTCCRMQLNMQLVKYVPAVPVFSILPIQMCRCYLSWVRMGGVRDRRYPVVEPAGIWGKG